MARFPLKGDDGHGDVKIREADLHDGPGHLTLWSYGKPVRSFQVIFYSDDEEEDGPCLQLHRATRKDADDLFDRALSAMGG